MNTLQVGQRVRTNRIIDIYPLDVFQAGLTGTVVEVDGVGPPVVALVRLDQHFTPLDQWDNALQVVANDSDESDCKVDCFDVITEQGSAGNV